MRVTKEVADILNLTFDEAIREHHEYVTPELLLYEIAARDTFREAFENCGGDTDMLRDNLREYMEQQHMLVSDRVFSYVSIYLFVILNRKINKSLRNVL